MKTFDAIISSLAFHYIESFEQIVEKVSGCLIPNGDFVFSIEHPIFTAYGSQDWYYDETGNILHFVGESYMPNKTENILTQIIHAFNGVAGIDAIVLGGSHATGTANKDSDIDIGIYYDETSFDLTSFRQKAASLDDEHRINIITDPGEWGPWINGGGWLKIDGIAVDILFRDTRKVITVIDDCIDGKISIDYQCGHPFGFVNSIYMGEVAYCKILCSNNSLISEQKKRLIELPKSYQKATIEKFLWECEFSQQCGTKAIGKGDVLYAAGSLFRCAVSLLQVLYAINGMYMLNEKGSLGRLLRQKEAFIPKDFANDVEAALSGLSKNTIQDCFDRIQVQYNEIFSYSRQTL